jgi:Putative transposase/Transposase zinc-binding domain
LYGLVKEHLAEFLPHARDEYKAPLPKYVENEFRNYLACGDFSRGFVLVKCNTCAHHLAVAFSCKSRTVCPSCAGRRMAGEAAFLVDRVLPSVPVRQYVLAFPYELSGLAATRPEVLTFLSRVFWEALRLRYRRWANDAGLPSASRAETGAVTGVHRAGSTLNIHVHFHVLCADGVYLEEHGEGESTELRFVPAPPPTRRELELMLERIYVRVMKWLKKRRLVRDDDDSHEPPALLPNEALTLAGMQRGTLVTLRHGADDVNDDDAEAALPPPPAPKTDAVVFERFNLHASVSLAADDDVGRERLCRYLTRPAFALGRIRLLRDGNVGYRVKKVSRHRTTERVMSPVEFLARLASIVAPPRFPLLRLHGVFASRHPWRARVVPKPPVTSRKKSSRGQAIPCLDDPGKAPSTHHGPDGHGCARPAPHGGSAPRGVGHAALAIPIRQALPTSSLLASGLADAIAPNILSLAHWQRLEEGALYARTSRIDWVSLLRRTFDVDLRVCARCGGRLSVRSVVTDPQDIQRLLSALARSRDPPAAA